MWSVLDELTDAFVPVVMAMEEECEIVDELVLTIRSNEHSDMLTYEWEEMGRNGICREWL